MQPTDQLKGAVDEKPELEGVSPIAVPFPIGVSGTQAQAEAVLVEADIEVLDHDRLESLQNPNSVKILQGVVLLLGGGAYLEQVRSIARVLEIPKEQIDEAIARLFQTQCLLEVQHGLYVVRSETFSAYVDRSIDPSRRASLLKKTMW